MSCPPTAQSASALRVLRAVQRTRTPDGRVHLPLKDGTVAAGRLLGCTGSAVFLDSRSIPVDQVTSETVRNRLPTFRPLNRNLLVRREDVMRAAFERT